VENITLRKERYEVYLNSRIDKFWKSKQSKRMKGSDKNVKKMRQLRKNNRGDKQP